MTQADRDNLIMANVGLVRRFARRAYRPGVPCELGDLVSAGYIGLCHAVDAFIPSRGCKFSTFAVPRIRKAIQVEMHEAKLIHLPRHIIEAKIDGPYAIPVEFLPDTEAAPEYELPLDFTQWYVHFPAKRRRWLDCWIHHKIHHQTQTELAAQYGVSRSCVSVWVRKTTARLRELASTGQISVNI